MSFSLNEEKLNLVNVVSASLFSEPRFNQENDSTAKLIVTLVRKVASKDPEFILKLALYVRDDLNIRSTANFLVALAANIEECTPFLKKYYHKTVRLPSDWLDIAALYQLLPDRALSGRAIPTSLRKAMQQKFIQFDAYQLAKYNKENSQKRKRKKAKKLAEKLAAEGKPVPPPIQKQITLKQMIRQLHINQPVSHVMCILGKKYPGSLLEFRDSGLSGSFDEQRSGKRMKLPVPETWETVISAKGNTADAWEELIDNRKLPFMAMLRNLRNLILAGVSPKHHRWVMSRLKDEKTVANSRQFPFSFFTAYEAVDLDLEKLSEQIKAAQEGKGKPKNQRAPPAKKGEAKEKKPKKIIIPKNMPTAELIAQYKEALDMAVKYSTVHNVKPIRGCTIAFCNASDEMVNGALSGRKIGRVKTLVEVGILLGLMCKYMCEECDFRVVAEDHISIELQPGNILANMANVMETVRANPGSFSFPHNYFDNLVLQRKKIDNFLFFSHGSHSNDTLKEISNTITKYRQEVNPNLLFVSVNLSGNKSVLSCEDMFAHPNDVKISGFSDAILQYVAEKGDGNQLDYIQHIDVAKNLEALAAKLDLRFNKQSYESKPSQFWSFLDKVQNCKNEGCSVKLPKEKLAEHFTVCDYRVVKCNEPLCPETMPFIQLAIHSAKCPFKQIQTQQARKWRNVKVFVSSTFLDMHGERDILTRFVFPEVRDYCKKHRINFFEVDLRWGVTQEEGENGSNLDVCLSEIDKCRPFFIGILGDRYGWVPSHYNVSEDPNLTWVKDYPAGRSITELEIYHGFLRDLGSQNSGVVFIRNSSLLQEIPDNYLPMFTSSAEDTEKLQNLKNQVMMTDRYVEYHGSWGGVVDGKPVVSSLESFRKTATECLMNGIKTLFPEGEELLSPLDIERNLHEEHLENKSRRFVGRKDALTQMFKYADSDATLPFVVFGKPGFGKSSLVAKFARDYAEKRPGSFVLPHFVGSAPGSSDIRHTLWRICTELKREYEIKEEIPETYKELKATFPRFLEQAEFGRPLILIIDSLHLFSDLNRPHSLEWLPSTLPVKVFLSTYSETTSFEALRLRQPEVPMFEVGNMSENDRKDLVRQTLFEYRKKLEETPSNNQMRLLLRKPDGVKPLWLYIACEELRNFGLYDELSNKIKSLGNNVGLILTQILQRFEKDYGKDVTSSLAYIACSRNGLSVDELMSLLARPGEKVYPRALWANFYRAIESYLRYVGTGDEATLTFFHTDMFVVVQKLYLKTQDQVTNIHKRLATFFLKRADPYNDRTWETQDRRAISELPYHLIKAKMLPELESALCDLSFMDRKISMGMVYELATDLQHGKELLKKDSGFSLFDDEKEPTSPAEECWRFITSNSFILSHNPSLLYQQAINQPDGTKPYELAKQMEQFMHGKTILQWRNKPTNFDACKLTLAGYADAMTACAFSPDGHRMVCASRDRTLKICDAHSGAEIAILQGHTNTVSACAYSPDGRVIVSASWDNTLKVWDAEVGTEVCTLSGHSRKVSCCVFSHDGKYILSGSWDFNMILWDYEARSQVTVYKSHIKPINSCAISPDDEFVISGSWDNTVKLWNKENGTVLRTFSGHTNSIRCVSFSPNGRQIVSTSSDCTIRVWNCSSDTCVTFFGHTKPVNSCTFSEDGKHLISASDDQTIKVWDPLGGNEKKTMRLPESVYGYGIDVSTDLKRCVVACNNCTVLLWDLISGFQIEELKGHSLCVNAVKFNPENVLEVASVSDDKSLILWNLKDATSTVLTGHEDSIKDLDYHPDGDFLVTASEDFTAIIWNLRKKKIERQLKTNSPVLCCSFSDDGSMVITGGKDGVLSLWDFKTGKLRKSTRAHSDWITHCSFGSGDNSKIATCSFDYTAKIWSSSGDELVEMFKFAGHHGSVTSLGWSDNNNRLVTTSSDCTLRIWDTIENAEITTLDSHRSRVNSCAWYDNMIISCGEDGLIKVWDALVGSEITSLEGHADTIRSVALSHDKSQIVSASEDCTVKVWDAKARKETSSHGQWVSGCAFDVNSPYAVTVSRDSSVNVWNRDMNCKCFTIKYYSPLTSCQFVGDSVFFAADNGMITKWNYKTEGFDDITEFDTRSKSPIADIKVFPSQTKLASCSWNNNIMIHEIGGKNISQKRVISAHKDWVNSIDVSSSENLLVSASHDGTLQIHNLQNNQSSVIDRRSNWVLSCAFSRSASLIASGNFDSVVSIWDSKTLQGISNLKLHNSRINNVCFAENDNYVVSSSNDRVVKLWDLRANSLTTSFVTKGQPTSLVAHKNSLCVGDSLGNVYFLDIV